MTAQPRADPGESSWRTNALTITVALSHRVVRGRSSPRWIPNRHRQSSACSTATAEKLQDWPGLSALILMPVAATFDKPWVNVDGVKSSRVSFLLPAVPSPSIGDGVLMRWQMCLSNWDDEAVNKGYISSQSIGPTCFFPPPQGFSFPVSLGSAITLCDTTTVAPTWCGTRNSLHILHFSSWRHLKAASSWGRLFWY